MRCPKCILPVVLLAALLSCSREALSGDVELCIRVQIPEMPETKAGTVAPEGLEAYIGDLRIWVFLSEKFDNARDSGYCLGFIRPGQGQHQQGAYEDRYFLKIPADIAHAQPDVDVYVLANSEQAGLGKPGSNTPRAKLDTMLLQGAYYGLQQDGTPTHLGPQQNGLPFSAVGKHLKMEGHYPAMNVKTVTLQRMVSKFRFVLSQLSDAVGPVCNFTINELSLDGGKIPVSQYVFNDSAHPFKLSTQGYLDSPVQFQVPDQVALNPSPQDYAFRSGFTGQDYETLVAQGIADGLLTDVGVCYLRESDKPLSGRIVYTMDGVQRVSTFQMDADDGFARGHSWIVYVYFLRDQMTFTVSWTPWEQGWNFDLSR